MKFQYSILFAFSLVGHLPAQPPVVVEEKTVVETVKPGGQVVKEETVTEKVVPGAPIPLPPAVRLDPTILRTRLGTAPRVLPAPPVTPVPLPGTKVETTEIETIVETPGLPPRVYNSERSVVIVEGRELPYVTIPVLFVKETAELLDTESRFALEDTATAIREIIATNPTAMFDIEGHTSTDGAPDMNLALSAARAKRVYEELTKRYSVPPSVLSAHGHGENYPMYPSGTEAQMTLDRRVLVVRVK